MKPEECKFFGICGAPICPLDPNKEEAVWYPDEAVCKNPGLFKLQFIKIQKKISRIHGKKGNEGVFTFKMLDRDIIVRSGIRGINEDLDLSMFKNSENAWIQRHRIKDQGYIEKRRLQISELNEEVRP